MSSAANTASNHANSRTRPRERILAASGDLFYRLGIRAVGVEAIAEAAGTNKMTLYRHFSSKDELVAEYLRRLAADAGKFWDRLEGQGGEAILQLRAAVLSEDDRLERYFAQRPGNPYRRRQPAKKGAKVA